MKGWLSKYQDGGKVNNQINYFNILDEYIEKPNPKDPMSSDNMMRHSFVESSWKNKAKSKAGALGPFQIRKIAYDDYSKSTGDKEPFNSVEDLDKAAKVRNWLIEDLSKAQFINRKQDEDVRLAKLYGAYNWGRGNMVNKLTELKNKGYDIYNSTDWIEHLPQETQTHIKRMVFKNDDKFEKDYKESLDKLPYVSKIRGLKDGGTLTSSKAKEILRDGTAHGHPLTDKQKRYFGWVAGGKAQDGGEVDAISGAAPKYWQIPIKQREDFKGNWLSKTASGSKQYYNTTYGDLGDLYRYYGGQPLKNNILFQSKYKPTNSKDKDVEYIAIQNDKFKNQVLDHANRIFIDGKPREKINDNAHDGGDYKINDNTYSVSGYSSRYKDYSRGDVHEAAIGRYFVSQGKDDRGNYISYYDEFDANKPGEFQLGHKLGATKPFEVYDRIYVDRDSTGRYVPREEFKSGGQLKKSKQLRTFTNGWVDKYL